MSVSVTYAGDTYTGDFAIRGSDFIRVYDDKGVLRHSFTGIQQISLFTITGTVSVSAFDESAFETYKMLGKNGLYFSGDPTGVSVRLYSSADIPAALKKGTRVVMYTSVASFETFIIGVYSDELNLFMTEELYNVSVKNPGNLGSFVALAYAPGTSAAEAPGSRYAYSAGLKKITCNVSGNGDLMYNMLATTPILCTVDANGRGQYVIDTSSPSTYVDYVIHIARGAFYKYSVAYIQDDQGDALQYFINVFVDRVMNNITCNIVCSKHSATIYTIGDLEVVWG